MANAVARRSRTKARSRVRKRRVDYYDFNLLAAVILLTCFGLVMLYSASAYEGQTKFGDDMYFFGKQAIISIAAILVAVIFSRIDYHYLMKVATLAFGVSLLLMVLVVTPLGVEANGSRRWLKLGVQFQPSEIAKIAVIIFLPYMILKMGRQVNTTKGVLILLAVGCSQAVFAKVFTDNLSTALIIGGISVVMVFLVYPKVKPFFIAGGIAGGAAAMFVLYLSLTIDSSSSFRIRRILVWLRPEENAADGGYQVMQGLYAIGSGGIFGKGLGNSVQKISTIPEAQNDMIFTVICEELGIFGGVLILLLFGYMLYRLFFIAQNAPDMYGSLVVSGIFVHMSLQVILNICVVLNIIPTTGVTLPFVSYEGTSVLFLMAEIGIALSVSRRIRFQQDDAEKTAETGETA